MPSKISVIVPVYNVEKYLAQCLESLSRQTLSDLEIICVEDCSTDNSYEVLKTAALKDPRISIVKNKVNQGLSACRNIGIEQCTSPYMMFLDSDDEYDETMCEKMAKAMDESNADVGICGVEIVYEDFANQTKSDEDYFANPNPGVYMLTRSMIGAIKNVVAWNKIYRASLIKENNIRFPEGRYFESYPFWGEICSVAQMITILPEKLYRYRRRAGGIMSSTFNKTDYRSADYVYSILEYRDWLIKNNLYKENLWNFWRLFLFCSSAALNYSKDKKHKEWIISLIKESIPDNSYERAGLGRVSIRALRLLASGNVTKKVNFFGPFNICRNIYSVTFGIGNLNLFCKQYGAGTTLSIFNIPIVQKRFYYGKFLLLLLKKIPLWVKYYDKNVLKIDFCRLLTSVIPKSHIGFKQKLETDISFCLFASNVKVKLHTNSFCELPIDNTNLLRELRQLGRFCFIPNPGNLGDCLIASATYDFFEKNKLGYYLYEKGQRPDTVVYGGGGIWVKDLYSKTFRPFLKVMSKARRIIILPSSIADCEELVQILDERFVVFCREEKSYNYLLDKNTGARIYLDHDMALRASSDVLKAEFKVIPQRIVLLKKVISILRSRMKDPAVLTRTDVEGQGNYPFLFDLSNTFGSRTMRKDDVSFATLLMLSFVDNFSEVITDRLHVGIAAAKMGKKVYLLDNNYGKLSGVYRHSLKSLKNVQLIDTFPDTKSSSPIRIGQNVTILLRSCL